MADIRINLKIKACSEKVYNALSTQKGLSGWWAKQTMPDPKWDL